MAKMSRNMKKALKHRLAYQKDAKKTKLKICLLYAKHKVGKYVITLKPSPRYML